jgi:AcrR family transcriptional regulator
LNVARKQEDAEPSAWRERSVSRSLERSRANAERRSAQFVETALKLVEETGGKDFTVQDIADRMRVSTRTFYQHFAGKDELMVAMVEEVQNDRSRRLREIVEAQSDPLARLRVAVIGSQRLTTRSVVNHYLFQHYFRLHLSHSDELRRSFRGAVDFLRGLVADAAEAGAIRSTDHDRTVALIWDTVTSAIQANVLGSPIVELPPSPEEVWEFCLSGIGAPSTDVDPASKKQ